MEMRNLWGVLDNHGRVGWEESEQEMQNNLEISREAEIC
jgi:hypothetical protein